MKRLAERKYGEYLTSVLQRMGGLETMGYDIEKAGKHYFPMRFRGVFASDQIPLLKDNEMAILNVDKSSQPGSHWVAVAKGKGLIYTYDSFGRPMNRIIPAVQMSGNGVVVDTELDPEQDVVEENCGQRCLAWLRLHDNYGWEFSQHI